MQDGPLRHVILAAISLQKSLIFSYFSIHRTDKLSRTDKVPFGARVDVSELCKLLKVKSDLELFRKSINELYSSNLTDDQNLDDNNQDVDPLNPFSFERSNINYKLTKIISFTLGCNQGCSEKQWHVEDKNIKKYLRYFTHIGGFIDAEFIPSKGLIYDIIPRKSTNSLEKLFIERNLRYDSPNVIGMANPHTWIYKGFYKLIDAGGAYRQMNPINADGHAPKSNFTRAEKYLNTNFNLIKDLYRHTGHPKFIKQLAVNFIQTYFENINYVGVHWRFNTDDFLGIGQKTSALYKIKEALINDINQTNIIDDPKTRQILGAGKGIPSSMRIEIFKTLLKPEYFLNKLIPHFEKHLGNETNIIFISSPQNVAEIFNKIGRNFIYQNRTFKIFTGIDTFQYLKSQAYSKSTSCELLKEYLGDVLSTFEKELMVLSKSFYRARPSNWSFNVQGQRFGLYKDLSHDRVIYDVFLNRDRKK